MSEDRFVKLVQENNGFGDKGLDISEQYGVTIGYSDIKDTSTGFHLRYLYTGNEVDLP